MKKEKEMLKNKTAYISFLLFCCCIFSGGAANLVSVKARLDSVNLLMGNLMSLHLEVVQPEGKQGNFVIFNNSDKKGGYATVCGDSVELRPSYSVDTTELGSGRLQLNYNIPVQAFDSGTYTLPPLAYVVDNDTAYSNPLTFNVVPVQVTADDPISGFAPVEEPDGKSIFDWVPDWLLDFWWLWLIIFLAVATFLWAMNNYKKKGGITQILSKPVVTPWEKALTELSDLKEKKLWEQGMEKEYFTRLTDILRSYLNERFGINAMEMTTRQIMDIILQSDFKDKKDYMRHILNVADFVKFAKVRPLPADNITAYENAVKFVEETIPAVKEDTSEDDNNSTKEGGDSR